MYKLNQQKHYSTPIDGIFLVQLIDDKTGNTIKSPSKADIEKIVFSTFNSENNITYRIISVMYDLTTEQYYALCKINS